MSIPQKDLRKAKEKKEDNVLPFISTFNPNNPAVFNTIKDSVEVLSRNKVPGFQNLNLINSKRQAPNLKKLLTKAEFTKNKETGVRMCNKPRCECCHVLLLGKEYKFKNVDKKFTLKSPMSCDSSNLVYVLICLGCSEEYIGETGIGKSKLRDRVRVYRQQHKTT